SRLDEPYATLHDRHGKRMTLYATLGNHDLGGSGWDETRVAHYVAYGRSRDWLHVPQAFWETQVGMVHLVGLHTSPLAYWGAEADLEAQGAMVKQVLATSSARWIVALGHHPYRSNGQHGNAGQYEGVPGDGFMVGGRFRAWVEEHLCGGVDVYMAGHEHNRQWLSPVADVPAWPPWLSSSERYPCRTRFGISGAGAKTTPLVDRGNPLDFGADTPGFVLLEFAPDQARIEMCDAEGRLEWSQVLVR
ncbi:MAG: metallophosphoesterase, partial [Myxococcota bacterium]